jgi:ATP-binding cassette subfamily B multidrug efflux pump
MLKLLKRLNKTQLLMVFVIIIFVVIQVWLDLKLPDYMTNITTVLQTPGSTTKDIMVPGSYMLYCALGSLVASVIVGYFGATLAAQFSLDLRKDVFRKVQSFGMEEIKKFSTSSLITRTTNDINQVQMLIAMGLQMLIKAPIMATWAILKILGKNWDWSIATGCAVIFLLFMITLLVLLVMPKFQIMQKLLDNLNNVTRENLTGIRVIRAFNAENYQKNKFENANEKLTNTQLFTQRMMALISPTMSLIMSGLTLSIYVIGAYLIDEANMLDKINLFSNMIVFSSYAMQVVLSFMLLSFVFIIYPRANVSAKRILEVLNTDTSIKDGNFDEDTKDKGIIEFNNVSFKYPDAEEYMLKNINFKVNKGEVVAFIGSTGSGKSTLINLIPRFYDASEGKILIDNIDVKDYKLSNLYNKLGYISQKAVMFTGNIKNNVNYGECNKKITEEDIKKAIEVAQAKDFVEKMPNKYESDVSEGGTNLSGGQKQRISIARAIAKQPEIYIFDDSFSALDYKTDFELRKELKKYTKEATILIVAQRIGTIKNADKIVVLDNGKMVGIGTHSELLKNNEVYKEIALSQLSKEELENA